MRRVCAFTGHLGFAAGALTLIPISLAKMWWPFELFTHFPLQYCAGLLVALLCYIFAGHWRLATLVLLPLAAHGAKVVALYAESEKPQVHDERLTLLSVNVLRFNERYDDVFNHIRSQNADIVLLMEIDFDWMKRIEQAQLPYRIVIAEPRSDTSGIVLLDRGDIVEAAKIVTPGVEFTAPSIEATLCWRGERMAFMGTHPSPPKGEWGANARNVQLAEIAEWAKKQTLPVVVIGDLNLTPFSPYFRDFVDESGLVSSHEGFGYQWSWPVEIPLLAIPIDHCLHSPFLVTLQREIGSDIGSDHKPLKLVLARARQ
ncbi:MAG: endonuclease/exonuclease/phosphatase family protein [Planctomycetes bacterium]|nr:endonuclease/exonuclease/phosphatase family protein [Planctomycetota bacterium]NUQ33605.1 endonuclease/exonuclease/phosphatase family protein [Planctomycetaceae bacterium]